MSAEIIQFPRVAKPDDADARDCRNCVNARFGSLTFCTVVGESILNEESAARECEAYEQEQE